MHIGIVMHPFGDSSKGLEQHIYETTRSLLEVPEKNLTFTVFVKGNPDTSSLPSQVHVVHIPDTFFWEITLLFWYRKCNFFIFFTESAPVFLWGKSIIVFFDAAYYYFRAANVYARIQQKMLIGYRKTMLSHVRHIVAISEVSKRDLIDLFSISPQRIHVIYPGFKRVSKNRIEVSSPARAPFFMYVGPWKERKNVLAIVVAFEQFKKLTGLEHQLYLVGRKSKGEYAEKVHTHINNSLYLESICIKEGVSDEDLERLYVQATALVFPSLLEGFGLPILEALSRECMVITSSTTSTREVLGAAGILVDPESVSEISAAMTRIAHKVYDRSAFLEQAKMQCAMFSWERSAREWCALFDNIRNSKG